MNKKIKHNRGLVRFLVVIVIALIILGYFGFNLRDTINSPVVQDNLKFAGELATNIWNNYLKQPMNYLWSDVFVKLIWNPIVSKALSK